jgi:hypothetical protein
MLGLGLGRLPRLAIDLMIISTMIAGIRRSTGFMSVLHHHPLIFTTVPKPMMQDVVS